jgi:mRNA-degrading endonuclease YafQ of YafQ-DinJ toxin-antitoxin module
MKSKSERRIEYTSLFDKQRKAAPLAIKQAFLDALALYLEDPNHPALRNHSLKREFSGYESIDVTEDWRALLKEKQTGEQKVIIFHRIGTHKELYG